MMSYIWTLTIMIEKLIYFSILHLDVMYRIVIH